MSHKYDGGFYNKEDDGTIKEKNHAAAVVVMLRYFPIMCPIQ